MVDVLERVLDKGIVIDAWLRLSVAGISIITVEARVIVASIETYLKHAEVVRQFGPLVSPPVEPTRHRKNISTSFRES
jgi:gas vesicle structural protein